MADAAVAPPEVTTDAFLGGRFSAVQPADGRHRSGLDAVLLAAAVDSSFAGGLVDLGSGAGVAGLAVAVRCPGARVLLVDRDEAALDCAQATLALPSNYRLATRVTVAAVDIAAPEGERAAGGLCRACADVVIMNPPFARADQGTPSPLAVRAVAHVLGETGLDQWFRTAASVLRPGGRLAVIFRAEGIDSLIAACQSRFGGIDLLPVYPRAHRPAHRIVVGAVKGSRALTRFLPPLVLHPAEGNGFMPDVQSILGGGVALRDVIPQWSKG